MSMPHVKCTRAALLADSTTTSHKAIYLMSILGLCQRTSLAVSMFSDGGPCDNGQETSQAGHPMCQQGTLALRM